MVKDCNPEINNNNEIELIKILNDKNIEYLKIKHDNPLSLQYKYIQNVIIQLTPANLVEKTWILLNRKN